MTIQHKSQFANKSTLGCAAVQSDGETICELVAQLSRVQVLANAWLAADEQQQLQHADSWTKHRAFDCGVYSFADHVRDSSRRC